MQKIPLYYLITLWNVEVVLEWSGKLCAGKYGNADREKYLWTLVLSGANWSMTFRKVTATAWTVNENKNLTSSHGSLACVLLLLAIFWCHLVHFFSEKSILPYFSSPRGVAILDCESHSQAGSTRLRLMWLRLGAIWVVFHTEEPKLMDYTVSDRKPCQVQLGNLGMCVFCPKLTFFLIVSSTMMLAGVCLIISWPPSNWSNKGSPSTRKALFKRSLSK